MSEYPDARDALGLAGWLDDEGTAGGSNWNRCLRNAAEMLREQWAEIERLRALEKWYLPAQFRTRILSGEPMLIFCNGRLHVAIYDRKTGAWKTDPDCGRKFCPRFVRPLDDLRASLAEEKMG